MMGANSLEWWLHSDGGLLWRIAIGGSILLVLAIADLSRHGRRATRWREYLFLLFAAAVALLYGLVHDQITAGISWEFFFYGKGLDSVLGPATPPKAVPFRLEVAKIGLKSAWSAGLVLGVAMLIANNPRKDRPQLGYSAMCRLVPVLLLFPVGGAVLFGFLGHFGLFALFSDSLRDLVRQNLFRPERFLTVAGIHLGSYAGALAALLFAIGHIRKRRKGITPDACGSRK